MVNTRRTREESTSIPEEPTSISHSEVPPPRHSSRATKPTAKAHAQVGKPRKNTVVPTVKAVEQPKRRGRTVQKESEQEEEQPQPRPIPPAGPLMQGARLLSPQKTLVQEDIGEQEKSPSPSDKSNDAEDGDADSPAEEGDSPHSVAPAKKLPVVRPKMKFAVNKDAAGLRQSRPKVVIEW
ncbi:hypothetical protein PQX77_016753, partial [Marasmius sp. AFHP31]